MDPSRRLVYVTALNLSKRMILGYVFRREDYPWVQNWEDYSPDGRMARGMEFATQPYFARSGLSAFYPEVVIVFSLEDPGGHVHVPLLLSPFGYTTYKGT